MTLEVTKAAEQLSSTENVSPHKLISLLMAGTLERVAQAKDCIKSGNEEDKLVLLGKIVAIVKGLRGSLDFKAGGEIAVNLDTLYGYMIHKLDSAENAEQESFALEEVSRLMEEVKSGWDEIATKAAA